MHLRPVFAETDQARIKLLIRDNPFGLLITAGARPEATHIPFVLEEREDGFVLSGHLAAGNPQCAALDGPALAVFGGPHAYISPSWYLTQPAVPTWDYAAVHVSGRLRPLEEEEEIARALRTLGAHDPGFDLDALPEKFRQAMLAGIRAFTLTPERVEAQWKMSQNRSAADRKSVMAALRGQGEPLAAEVADLIAATLPGAA
ncbi:MAG: FMN-binding negative transcriptional regulator [Acidisphaera sp.]|nr:FMN-binding negative transcriptional regulator [Acidisphaera sp.]